MCYNAKVAEQLGSACLELQRQCSARTNTRLITIYLRNHHHRSSNVCLCILVFQTVIQSVSYKNEAADILPLNIQAVSSIYPFYSLIFFWQLLIFRLFWRIHCDICTSTYEHNYSRPMCFLMISPLHLLGLVKLSIHCPQSRCAHKQPRGRWVIRYSRNCLIP
jgi:hypothetical protein